MNKNIKPKSQLIHTILIRVLLPIMSTIVMVTLYVYIGGSGFLSDDIVTSNSDFSIWQIFYSLVATLYAICVAFLLVKEMQDFAELKASFKTEAFVLKSINMYLYFFEENMKSLKGKVLDARKESISLIRKNINDYIVLLLKNDLIGERGDLNIEDKIWNSITQVGKLETCDDNDKIALEKLMEKHEDLFLLRSTRSGWIDTGLSPYLMLFLVVLSFFIIFPFFTFSVENPIVIYMSLGALVFFLTFLLGTLIDLGNPFSGHWKIPTKSYESLLEHEYKI